MKRIEKKRMHPALKVLIAVVLVSVIVFAGIIAYVYFQLKGAANQVFDDGFASSTSELRETDVSFNNEDSISVVLFGTDDDEARNESGMGQRSDTIMVVTLNPDTDQGKILSIPRDTRTEIAERGTVEKINHAHAYGGPEMAMRTVENFLDMPIDHFVSINMDGFTTIIDAIGGVTVTSQDTFQQGDYQFTAGETYEMDGDMALAFSRSRKSEGAGGDSGRQMRQQLVVQSIAQEILSLQTITNFNSVLSVLSDNVRTDVPFGELNALRSNYQEPARNVERLTLEGTDQRLDDGLWYFLPDDDSYNQVRNEMRQNLELE
ncbi:LCP family protein [Salinicoccus hispanicus]|uniref:LytR family transcriptional regulator n=1 Tax=Salinicoccus hispanicus TaxID=157225 RepID=A0A6N8U1A3_9STAP|nr:LCP family protein [Salinicoccus hispanicus]MXQ50726.1 LytR family transcriptional regulator [Salinicoccus hispanicus]